MPNEPFPRSAAYDRDWAEEHSVGENVLHFVESLSQVMELRPGMRILDLGCGHALSSIFLAREFGVRVWAVDFGVDPSANQRRIEEFGCADLVQPLRADVRALPLPHDFFDAAVAFDSYRYFGTDQRFLTGLLRHLRPDGRLGIVDACTSREISTAEDLGPGLRRQWLDGGWYLVHSIEWWRRHLTRTGLLDITLAEPLPGSDAIRTRYLDRFRHDPEETEMVTFMEAEEGGFTGSFRLVAHRTARQPLLEDDGETPY
ncbi:SAM-dependent methyltransferase [Micromonospora sagamiensis]|uniref:Methyltransferase family protein n=1 Tax=Micromonospora sagamiensis TaxID=47875 RepID=A0A562WH40_9ACTN|nr:methyltransferase domain-containing protein [Micromonospora sagamiensis]TWJ29593.1 methyltransferase family protein [Micromonospora sagamiensis]BCL17378.1 SAM-dependent methyltransferase [Micromonospora sagamiensis]